MQPTRFCSRSADCFTFAPARGYLRGISAKVAQAASRSFSAASDWPSRSSESGARGPDPQQRTGRAPRFVVLGRDLEKDLGGVTIALALKQRLAEPVVGVR